MGWIEKRHMQSGGSLNRNPANNGSQSGPLRKIIATVRIDYAGGGCIHMEALECGHIQMPKSDMIGHTAPVRRRCKHCKAGRPTHFTGTPLTEMSKEEYEKVYQKPENK
jgi:hypothetical protein